MSEKYYKPSYAKQEIRKPPLINPDLYNKLNILSVLNKISIPELVNKAIEEYLKTTNIEEYL